MNAIEERSQNSFSQGKLAASQYWICSFIKILEWSWLKITYPKMHTLHHLLSRSQNFDSLLFKLEQPIQGKIFKSIFAYLRFCRCCSQFCWRSFSWSPGKCRVEELLSDADRTSLEIDARFRTITELFRCGNMPKEESKEGLLDDGSVLTWAGGKSLAVFPCCMREDESAVFCVRLRWKKRSV